MSKNVLRVLIVEDSEDDAILIRRVLQRDQFQIEFRRVENEDELRSALGGEWDVVISDYTLPSFNAQSALEIVKQVNPDLPFIIVSGSIGEETAVRMVKQGVTDYLLKDRLTRLGASIRRAQEEARLRRERREAEALIRIKDWAIESSINAIAFTDLRGFITYVNPAFLTTWGYDHTEEVIGLHSTTFLDPPEQGKTIAQAIANQGFWHGYFTARRRDGTPLIIESMTNLVRDTEGAPISYMGSYVDVTDRMMAEQAAEASQEMLRWTEARLRAVVEGALDGVLIVDLHGAIQMVNPAIEQLFGYREDELLGEDFGRILPRTSTEAAASFIQRHVRRTSAALLLGIGHEVTGLRKDGQVFPLELTFAEVTLGDERLFIGTLHDVSERKAAEAARRTAEVLRVELEKEKELRELKSRFVSMVSHEFKNPIAIIRMSASMLADYFNRMSPEQRAEKLNDIQQQTQRIVELIDEVLFIGRGEAGRLEFQPAEVDFNQFALQTIDEVAKTIGQSHKLVCECSVTVRAQIDERLMRRALINLFDNAIKYSAPGTTIRCCLETADSYFIVHVVDEGIGIPNADLKRMFEPFHRASNTSGKPGTGLGMVIVKQTVEMHGGSIAIESELGVGTTVTLFLPYGTISEH